MLGKLKKRRRLRKHGYLKRSATKNGLRVLKARRRKWRASLTVSYPKKFQTVKWKAKLHIIAWGKARKKVFNWKWELI